MTERARPKFNVRAVPVIEMQDMRRGAETAFYAAINHDVDGFDIF